MKITNSNARRFFTVNKPISALEWVLPYSKFSFGEIYRQRYTVGNHVLQLAHLPK